MVKLQGIQGVEPFVTFLKARPDGLIAPYYNPDKINIVVVGGDTNTLWKYSEYSWKNSMSVDKWRHKKTKDEYTDGSCGILDPDD